MGSLVSAFSLPLYHQRNWEGSEMMSLELDLWREESLYSSEEAEALWEDGTGRLSFFPPSLLPLFSFSTATPSTFLSFLSFLSSCLVIYFCAFYPAFSLLFLSGAVRTECESSKGPNLILQLLATFGYWKLARSSRGRSSRGSDGGIRETNELPFVK